MKSATLVKKSYHIRKARTQQVTLSLNLLNQGIDKAGIFPSLVLSVSEELYTVIAHSITLLQKHTPISCSKPYKTQHLHTTG